MVTNPINNSQRDSRGYLNSLLVPFLDSIYVASGILAVIDVAEGDYLPAAIEGGVAFISAYISSRVRKRAKSKSQLENLTRENI